MEKEEVKKTQEKKPEKKKMIVPRTAIKGLINGFVAYGILLLFIFLSINVVITWLVENHKATINYDVLKITIPLIFSILAFFLVRATCRLSTFDLFKTCRIKKDEVENVCTKMNLFYLGVVIFAAGAILLYLFTRFSDEKVILMRDLSNYSQSNSSYARQKEDELIENYEINKQDVLIQTTIVEIGLLSGLFSLIPKQKKLIQTYN